MAVGSYGIIRPADVSPADVEILYHYVSGRTTDATVTLTKLDSATVLTPVYHNTNTDSSVGKTATGKEILTLAEKIQSKIKKEFGILIVPEVNVV